MKSNLCNVLLSIQFQNRTHELREQAEEILEQTKLTEIPKSSMSIPEQELEKLS